jgi:hypothetical protein
MLHALLAMAGDGKATSFKVSLDRSGWAWIPSAQSRLWRLRNQLGPLSYHPPTLLGPVSILLQSPVELGRHR